MISEINNVCGFKFSIINLQLQSSLQIAIGSGNFSFAASIMAICICYDISNDMRKYLHVYSRTVRLGLNRYF